MRKKKIGCAASNSNCCKKTEVPSDEEVAVLAEMREIKMRVKELKKRLSEISLTKGEHLGKKSRLENEIAELKAEWNVLDEKKKRAAHDRMILLGYNKTE